MTRPSPPTDIDRLRKKIDLIDSKLASLLEERTRLASQIIVAKELAGTAVTDAKRERTIIKHYLATLKHPIKAKRVQTLVKAVLELTPQYKTKPLRDHQ